MFASFENQTKYPAIIIAPQCPAEKTWSEYKGLNAGKEGKRFYPLNASGHTIDGRRQGNYWIVI